MSKITDAIRKAESDRGILMGSHDLQGSVRQFEAALLSRRAGNGQAVVLTASKTTTEAPVTIPTTTGTSAVKPPVEKAIGGVSQQYSLESWEQAIELVTKKLEECEQRIAEHNGEQVRLQARLKASEELKAEIEREQATIREAQTKAQQQTTLIEKNRTVWLRQLEALRECAVLSQACRVAEGELSANDRLVAQTLSSQEKIADELAHFNQRGEALRQQVVQLRFKLASALASTGTTDATTRGAS